MTQAMMAPARTPWIAYPFSLLMFGVWTYGKFTHAAGAETWPHRLWDALPLTLGILALPPLREQIAKGAVAGIALYRQFRAAKKEPQEGDSNRTLPPRRGGGGQ